MVQFPFDYIAWIECTLNLQKTKYSQCNQIQNYLFERLETKKNAASKRKKAERKYVIIRFGRCQSTPPIA